MAGADERKSAVKKSREISAEVMRRRMERIETGKVDIGDWGSMEKKEDINHNDLDN